jgi:hypothetical protein
VERSDSGGETQADSDLHAFAFLHGDRFLAQQAEAGQAHPALPQEVRSPTTATIEGKTVGYDSHRRDTALADKEGKVRQHVLHLLHQGRRRRCEKATFSFFQWRTEPPRYGCTSVSRAEEGLADENGFRLKPPHQLVNNDHSILDLADIVFIDPVSTGYSRAVPGVDPGRFHGYREDLESVEFIRLYLTRYDRWESPKFVIGKAGSRRAAGLSSI